MPGARGLHEEGGDVHESLPDADVTLTDQHTRVVHRLRELHLVDHGLESSLEEVLGLESEHVIELELVLGENAEEVEATEERTALEDASLVVLVEGKKVTCPLADLGEEVVDAVHLTLAAEPVDAAETELVVEALLLVGATGGGERSGVGSQGRNLAHCCCCFCFSVWGTVFLSVRKKDFLSCLFSLLSLFSALCGKNPMYAEKMNVREKSRVGAHGNVFRVALKH